MFFLMKATLTANCSHLREKKPRKIKNQRFYSNAAKYREWHQRSSLSTLNQSSSPLSAASFSSAAILFLFLAAMTRWVVSCSAGVIWDQLSITFVVPS
mmetsp:Transcript_1479/g.3195  ORF Transcript_1479/g.3195 Transcript_1479/m.3195 type:complete len:98 (-) Transcript_1479:473-766(-)